MNNKVRLIDANALIKLKSLSKEEIEYFSKQDINLIAIGDIMNAPTIDPICHSKWITKHDDIDGMYCQDCYSRVDISNLGNYDYCPYCGSKMDLK